MKINDLKDNTAVPSVGGNLKKNLLFEIHNKIIKNGGKYEVIQTCRFTGTRKNT